MLSRRSPSSPTSGGLVILFAFVPLKFCFPSGIDEAVAAMVCWNKVSPASTYLDNVRSSADKGPVRVCVVGSVGSLQILAVCVSIKESRWLAIGVATSTPSSVLLCGMVQFLQIHGPVVMDCKPVLRGVMLQPMFLQRFLDLISSGE